MITRLDGLRGWTSHRRYLGRESEPAWLVTDYFADMFDSLDEMKALILRLHQKAEPWPRGMRNESGWFLWHLCPVDVDRKKKRQEDQSGVPIAELLRDICEITGVELSRLREPIRGPRGNPERRFAVWALQKSTHMTYRQISEVLEMTPQHVARDVRRNRARIKAFSDWREDWMERYPAKVSIVQA